MQANKLDDYVGNIRAGFKQVNSISYWPYAGTAATIFFQLSKFTKDIPATL